MSQQLSSQTQKLISQYQLGVKTLQPTEGVSMIHVDEVASKVAAFYEKIRGIIDWKEEHLLRRGAIQRILKRRFLAGLDILQEAALKESVAEPLVLELIRGGHYPNDALPETKISDVQKIINRYVFILKNTPQAENGQKSLQFYNWFLSIVACEIEETLSSSFKERALIDYMFELMKERIVINEGAVAVKPLKEDEKNIQIYIAVQEALFKLDGPIISYNLIKYKYPQWQTADEQLLLRIAEKIYKIRQKIEKDLSHPLGKKFYTICEKYDTPYLLLGDILSEENPSEVAEKTSNPEVLETLIKKHYEKRLSTLKRRLFRAALYTTLSVLLGNGFSLFLLEMPLARLIHGKFTPLSIIVDIFESTILMFLFVATIKPPSKKNLNLVIMETMKIAYQKEKTDIYEIKTPRKRGLITRFIIALIYLFGASVSLTILIWIFQLAKFPVTSIIINIIFITITVFAGLAVRKKSEELTIEEKKVGFLGFFFDIFSLPVASLGKWLAGKWKKYNAIAVFFSALIDMPFAMFVEFLEQWRYFLKEKKEEIH